MQEIHLGTMAAKHPPHEAILQRFVIESATTGCLKCCCYSANAYINDWCFFEASSDNQGRGILILDTNHGFISEYLAMHGRLASPGGGSVIL